jgi:Zn ribbon nucleic-acid-binding protein
MPKCPKCEEGDLLAFLEKTKPNLRDPNATEEYEIVHVCSKCGYQVRRGDLPLIYDT